MANTRFRTDGARISRPAPALRLARSPQIETITAVKNDAITSLSPEIRAKIAQAKAHYASLDSLDVYAHACTVLKAAMRGKLLLPSTNGADPFSLRLAELILYHPFETDSYLPNANLTPGFEKRFAIHTGLKHLDSRPGDRSADYVRLLNPASPDLTDLLIALYARIADMMTVHDPATVRAASMAASMKMPGLFPMHENWEHVKTAWAEPMLGIYCPISDWGAQTVAYRAMRDNAVRYLYPREFAETAERVEKRIPALDRTNEILTRVLELISERLNLRVLVAHHYSEVSQAFPELDSRTVAVSIRPFKGVGGLLNKSLKRGMPIEKVHDWAGFTVIAETESLMYDVVAFLRNEGIRQAASEFGISELCVLGPVDYARNPKPVTRYRSVHLDTVSVDPRMVPMEAIVRTREMHMEADEGTAGHDIYKLSPLQNGERRSLMQRLDEIVANSLSSLGMK